MFERLTGEGDPAEDVYQYAREKVQLILFFLCLENGYTLLADAN